jgi:hypothetical protein
MLTVVQNQEPTLRAKDPYEPLHQISIRPLLNAEHPDHCGPQQSGIPNTAQVNQINPVGEPRRQNRRFLNRQASLTDTSRPDQRHEPVISKELRDFRKLPFAAKQPCQGHRQA